jgi:hypothetical protein
VDARRGMAMSGKYRAMGAELYFGAEAVKKTNGAL